MSSLNYKNLLPGDPAPWFVAASTNNPTYDFNTAAGRYIVLSLVGTVGDEVGQRMLAAVARNRALFDNVQFSFYGVVADQSDQGGVRQSIPGIRYFLDFDGAVSRALGALPQERDASGAGYRRLWIVLDPTLRVLRVFPFLENGLEQESLFEYLKGLPIVDMFAGFQLQAPILYLHNVFESEFCHRLIDAYNHHGGELSGFMRELEGKTVGMMDRDLKVRRDYHIKDEALIKGAYHRIKRRIFPEISKIHQFKVSRIERHMVSCYSADDGGHFSAHRDNTTKATAHRRFAVSINLNADFEGGELQFPEYGSRSFKPQAGAAVIFSCSLLHKVLKVRSGRRYAFLPFLYDEAAAQVRDQNKGFLSDVILDNNQSP